MNNYIILFLLSVFIASLSQIILKSSALKKHSSKLKEYLNVRVIVAYSMFMICTMITMFAYRKIPLSFGPLLETTSYVYIFLFSTFIFKEKFSFKMILGNILIICGIIVFSFPVC